jgi:hypothetical protein
MSYTITDFDWNEFVDKLFTQPPCEPFTYAIEFLDTIDTHGLTQLLGIMLINGVRNKYNKEIAQLSPNEIQNIREYYHSIGYDISYTLETTERDSVPINKFNINFTTYPRQYDTHNRPDIIS